MQVIISLITAFLVLGTLSIVLISLGIHKRVEKFLIEDKDNSGTHPINTFEIQSFTEVDDSDLEMSTGELNLIGVDESTAAIIIATICDHLQTPLNELKFKSIKALD
jgi:hypothetical protein